MAQIGDKFQIQVRRRGDGVKQFTVMALTEGLATADIKLFLEDVLEGFISQDEDGTFDCGAPIMIIKRKDRRD